MKRPFVLALLTLCIGAFSGCGAFSGGSSSGGDGGSGGGDRLQVRPGSTRRDVQSRPGPPFRLILFRALRSRPRGRAAACPRRSRSARRSLTRARRLARLATASPHSQDAPVADAAPGGDPGRRLCSTTAESCGRGFPASAEQAVIQNSSSSGSRGSAIRAVR